MFSSNNQLEPSLTNEFASYAQNLRRLNCDASMLNYDASFAKVKNKIAYHLINLIKKLKYRRIDINKQRGSRINVLTT